MDDASAHPQPDGARGRRRAGILALASVLVLAVLGIGASVAQAEEPRASNAILTCKTITVTYSGFPNTTNTIKEKVRIDGVQWAVEKTFVFTGTEGTDHIEINLPPGEHALDLFSKWKVNGVNGGRDQFLGKIKCEDPEPGIGAEKFQKYSTKEKYVQETLKLGHVGNVVNYKIIVRNLGNEPEKVELSDPECDPGTIKGGLAPNEELPRFGSTTYFCNHTITTADQEAEFFCNTASVTGTPKEGEVVQANSNTVCVEVPRPKNKVEFGCKVIRDEFTGFPNATNKVQIKIYIDGTKVLETIFTFTGSSAVFTYEANLSPGHHSVDVFTKWVTNGFKGGSDQTLAHGITCLAEPGFSIQKFQKIEGQPEYTQSEVEGSVGQTVDYKIVVTNTGNTSLKLGPLNDSKCDEGTLEGPTEPTLAPGTLGNPPGSATYTCKHTLTVADEIAGEYTNSASDTATPPEGQGGPVTEESNTVVADVDELV